MSNSHDKLGTSKADDVERRLDNAIEESFPASDPVSLAQPHDPEELGLLCPIMPPSAWLVVGGGLLAVLALVALRK